MQTVGKPHAKADIDLTLGALTAAALALQARITAYKNYLDTLSLADLQDATVGYTAGQAQEVKDATAELGAIATAIGSNAIAAKRVAGPVLI